MAQWSGHRHANGKVAGWMLARAWVAGHFSSLMRRKSNFLKDTSASRHHWNEVIMWSVCHYEACFPGGLGKDQIMSILHAIQRSLEILGHGEPLKDFHPQQ